MSQYCKIVIIWLGNRIFKGMLKSTNSAQSADLQGNLTEGKLTARTQIRGPSNGEHMSIFHPSYTYIHTNNIYKAPFQTRSKRHTIQLHINAKQSQ